MFSLIERLHLNHYLWSIFAFKDKKSLLQILRENSVMLQPARAKFTVESLTSVDKALNREMTKRIPINDHIYKGILFSDFSQVFSNASVFSLGLCLSHFHFIWILHAFFLFSNKQIYCSTLFYLLRDRLLQCIRKPKINPTDIVIYILENIHP